MVINNKKINKFEDLILLLPIEILERLELVKNVRENPKWHPEDSLYEHIKIVTTRLLQTEDVNLVISAIFHDLGKPETAKMNKKSGYNSNHGHEIISLQFLNRNRVFVESMGCNFDEVVEIVKNHMRYKQKRKMKLAKQLIMENMEIYPKLIVFGRADNMLEEFYL